MSNHEASDNRPRSDDTAELSARFRQAWTTLPDPSSAQPELLPVRLTRACVQVLPIQGAGLSLMNGAFRVPLGASDPAAGCAERLQFTQGEGPCLTAAAEGRTLVLSARDIEQIWPQYADELFRHTDYRAVMSVPLALGDDTRGALDLFLSDETQLHALSLAAASTVAERIVDALVLARTIAATATPQLGTTDEPAWLLAPTVLRREAVWIAMGMVMTRHDIDAADALSLIRAFAYGHDTDLDDVADRTIRGEINVNVLAP